MRTESLLSLDVIRRQFFRSGLFRRQRKHHRLSVNGSRLRLSYSQQPYCPNITATPVRSPTSKRDAGIPDGPAVCPYSEHAGLRFQYAHDSGLPCFTHRSLFRFGQPAGPGIVQQTAGVTPVDFALSESCTNQDNSDGWLTFYLRPHRPAHTRSQIPVYGDGPKQSLSVNCTRILHMSAASFCSTDGLA